MTISIILLYVLTTLPFLLVLLAVPRGQVRHAPELLAPFIGWWVPSSNKALFALLRYVELREVFLRLPLIYTGCSVLCCLI